MADTAADSSGHTDARLTSGFANNARSADTDDIKRMDDLQEPEEIDENGIFDHENSNGVDDDPPMLVRHQPMDCSSESGSPVTIEPLNCPVECDNMSSQSNALSEGEGEVRMDRLNDYPVGNADEKLAGIPIADKFVNDLSDLNGHVKDGPEQKSETKCEVSIDLDEKSCKRPEPELPEAHSMLSISDSLVADKCKDDIQPSCVKMKFETMKDDKEYKNESDTNISDSFAVKQESTASDEVNLKIKPDPTQINSTDDASSVKCDDAAKDLSVPQDLSSHGRRSATEDKTPIENIDSKKSTDLLLQVSQSSLDKSTTSEKLGPTDSTVVICAEKPSPGTSSASPSTAAATGKSPKGKSKTSTSTSSAPDNVRPVGRLLYELGLDLVREEVYKDLVDIQAAKDEENRLDDKEKGQLVKLAEAHARLRAKNASYSLARVRCERCHYSCTARNVLTLHHEHGHRARDGVHACCACGEFRTRYASTFVVHMEQAHGMNGRVAKKLEPGACSFCPYEHKNAAKVEAHASKCAKKFQLASNLQPLPSDCDIPIRYKPASWVRPGYDAVVAMAQEAAAQRSAQPGGVSPAVPTGIQPSVMEIGGQLYSWSNHRGKPLLTSLRSQVTGAGGAPNGPAFAASTPALPAGVIHSTGPSPGYPQQDISRGGSVPRMGGASVTQGAPQRVAPRGQEPCEICGMLLDGRAALWSHLRVSHKVELNRASVSDQEGGIICDVCRARFWTYQGLARHSLLLHKRNIGVGGAAAAGGSTASPAPPAVAGALRQWSSRCHLCGAAQTSNPLNHLSTQHNVTLLDMYHGRQCAMCDRRLRTGRAFEDHMVTEHRDIFANQGVLRTVLQALSTALYLKSEDVQQQRAAQQRGGQPAQQQQQQRGNPQQRSSQQQQQPGRQIYQPGIGEYMRGGQYGSSAAVNNTVRAALAASRSRDPFTPPQPSSGGDRRPRTGTRPEGQRAAESTATAVKPPPDKKSTEEEEKALNKLYQDYADIGRPISRAMKQKLLLSPSAVAPEGSAEVAGEEGGSKTDTNADTGDAESKKCAVLQRDVVRDVDARVKNEGNDGVNALGNGLRVGEGGRGLAGGEYGADGVSILKRERCELDETSAKKRRLSETSDSDKPLTGDEAVGVSVATSDCGSA